MINLIRNGPLLTTINTCASRYLQKCAIHRSTTNLIDQRWRKEKGLPANPNRFGPLTNYPDYTFMDGRPTPLGSHQKLRVEKQRYLAAKIVQYLGEMDFAVERHKKLGEDKIKEKENILSNKLKPKGHLLLKKE